MTSAPGPLTPGDEGPVILTRTNAARVGRLADAPDWAFPFPPRDGCRVTPMIEAAEMYPELERMTLAATRSVWLAFRVFDPDTKARSDEAKARGLDDWTALIGDAVRRGVEVRVLLTDFEPVMADHLHAGSWASFHRLRALVDTLDEASRERLQLIVIQHEGEVGWAWRQLLRLPMGMKLRRMVARLATGEEAEDGGLSSRPGLWPHTAWEGERPRGWRRGPPPRLWPATYHQKFAVFDGTLAMIGGLDLDERRWDDRWHRQRADRTWHDISARVEGPAAGDAARHFARLWNLELPRFRQQVAEWTSRSERRLVLDPLTELSTPALPDPVPGGTATVQIARTLSRRSSRAFAFGPVAHIRELRAAHRLLIRSARRLLYVEAQFFRSRQAARWVARALRTNPALEVIILVANAPEEVAFEGQADNPAHRHGEWLQTRALGRIKRIGGDRVGLFSLAKPERVRGSEQQFDAQRGSAFGAGLIHIHAKMLLADDATCLLSSANINGRSFDWDTELGLIWREEGDALTAFRSALWKQLLGAPQPADAGLAEWRAVADRNRQLPPEERQGFVIPYQLVRARRFARPYWFVPDDLV